MSDILRESKNAQVTHLLEKTEKMQKELSKVKEENRRLKHILTYGNISTLETLIDQYMNYSRTHLKKITLEIQLTDYEKESAEKVMELIEHLDYVKMELHKLIAVDEEGAVIHNASLKMDVRLVREIIPQLENITHLHLDTTKSMELVGVLKEFEEKVSRCL